MADVSINGTGMVTGSFSYTEPDGTTIIFYGWTFSVTVDGQVGVYTVWIDSDTNENAAAQDAIDDLENDPDAMGGISQNDGPDQGDPGDEPDDDDGVYADGGGGGDDLGESV